MYWFFFLIFSCESQTFDKLLPRWSCVENSMYCLLYQFDVLLVVSEIAWANALNDKIKPLSRFLVPWFRYILPWPSLACPGMGLHHSLMFPLWTLGLGVSNSTLREYHLSAASLRILITSSPYLPTTLALLRGVYSSASLMHFENLRQTVVLGSESNGLIGVSLLGTFAGVWNLLYKVSAGKNFAFPKKEYCQFSPRLKFTSGCTSWYGIRESGNSVSQQFCYLRSGKLSYALRGIANFHVSRFWEFPVPQGDCFSNFWCLSPFCAIGCYNFFEVIVRPEKNVSRWWGLFFFAFSWNCKTENSQVDFCELSKFWKLAYPSARVKKTLYFHQYWFTLLIGANYYNKLKLSNF